MKLWSEHDMHQAWQACAEGSATGTTGTTNSKNLAAIGSSNFATDTVGRHQNSWAQSSGWQAQCSSLYKASVGHLSQHSSCVQLQPQRWGALHTKLHCHCKVPYAEGTPTKSASIPNAIRSNICLSDAPHLTIEQSASPNAIRSNICLSYAPHLTIEQSARLPECPVQMAEDHVTFVTIVLKQKH